MYRLVKLTSKAIVKDAAVSTGYTLASISAGSSFLFFAQNLTDSISSLVEKEKAADSHPTYKNS